jgi:hypothetical protein
LGSKLGAKVGGTEADHQKHLIDFQDETLGAKLGAKVGDPEASSLDFLRALPKPTVRGVRFGGGLFICRYENGPAWGQGPLLVKGAR